MYIWYVNDYLPDVGLDALCAQTTWCQYLRKTIRMIRLDQNNSSFNLIGLIFQSDRARWSCTLPTHVKSTGQWCNCWNIWSKDYCIAKEPQRGGISRILCFPWRTLGGNFLRFLDSIEHSYWKPRFCIYLTYSLDSLQELMHRYSSRCSSSYALKYVDNDNTTAGCGTTWLGGFFCQWKCWHFIFEVAWWL